MLYSGDAFKRARLDDDLTVCDECDYEIEDKKFHLCGACEATLCSGCCKHCDVCAKADDQGNQSYAKGMACCENCIEYCQPCCESFHSMCKVDHMKTCVTLSSESAYRAAKMSREQKENTLSSFQEQLEELQKRIQDLTKVVEIARQDEAKAKARMEAQKAKKPATVAVATVATDSEV